jgi:hypothetical protein
VLIDLMAVLWINHDIQENAGRSALGFSIKRFDELRSFRRANCRCLASQSAKDLL